MLTTAAVTATAKTNATSIAAMPVSSQTSTARRYGRAWLRALGGNPRRGMRVAQPDGSTVGVRPPRPAERRAAEHPYMTCKRVVAAELQRGVFVDRLRGMAAALQRMGRCTGVVSHRGGYAAFQPPRAA